jgi:hypothetical protein
MSSHYGIETTDDFGPLFRQVRQEACDGRGIAPAVRAAGPAVQQVQRRPDRNGGAVPGMPMPGVPADRPRARSTDPATSHEAAAGVVDFAADHHARILEALTIGPAGATEIADRAGLGRDQVGKRLCELQRRGQVVIDGKVRNAKGRTESRYRILLHAVKHGRATDGRCCGPVGNCQRNYAAQ